MKKLTRAEKRILKVNLRSFEKHRNAKKVYFIGFHLRKLNSLAKKYNIDLYAVPIESKDTYSFQYNEKSYSPRFDIVSDLYENKFETARAAYPDKNIALFILIPYFKTGKIKRKNFYKEDLPAAYCDFLIYS